MDDSRRLNHRASALDQTDIPQTAHKLASERMHRVRARHLSDWNDAENQRDARNPLFC